MHRFSRDNDRLTIFDVQPDDEGLYVCRIRQGNTATDTVGGCVIITGKYHTHVYMYISIHIHVHVCTCIDAVHMYCMYMHVYRGWKE